ncbi:unnamed protein product [Leptidea sinapis]|uniref:Regulatory protein zeste n=1 Tax=Leptidea sinapis TaxID=189913 RepID=A0A5E4Q6X1_9NEOP|nr:unnamed protein product [Leptidea sinapis]
MSTIKRNRSTNWDEDEKQLLLCILKDYTPIIEDKCLYTNSIKRKTKAWEEVHQRFNSLNNRNRDVNQLRLQWKSMKINARKTAHSNNKRETSSGARPPSPHITIEVKDLLNPAQLFPDLNKCDSDGIKNRDEQINTSRMASHSPKLKDTEFARRMEMAEEKHALEIEILRENLKQAQIERQISEKKLIKICSET